VTLLSGVSVSVAPGELVAIVGGSGAGKTTLLEALAAVQPADQGRVLFDDVDLYSNAAVWRRFLGYVPQEDIIHAELPLARTLRYAAKLRLPADSTSEEIDRAVAEALRSLGLEQRADVPVRALSGGQRKRASIAVEMLTQPRAFFLDEPTSGLDPATAAGFLHMLRGLADRGATVLFTTHAVQDLAGCDRMVFLAEGGHLVFVGTPVEAREYFQVETVEEIYQRLAGEETPEVWAGRFRERAPEHAIEAPVSAGLAVSEQGGSAGGFRQWKVLTQRTLESLLRNRLTMAILLGSPAMVVAMFAILFRPGAFDFANPEPSAVLMILFWITFGSFFFGLTYGLLQITTERAILRREHLVGLRLGPYLMSKAAVLLPFLLAVNVLMLAVLRALDRLPVAGLAVYMNVGVTLTLLAAAALGLGLLTSAAVSNPSQATLALPLLSFPAVLFSGAILPVHIMAGVGAGFSVVIPVRWAFEGIGHDFRIRELLTEGGSPLGPPLVASYGDAGLHSTGFYWWVLAAFAAAFFVAAWGILHRTAKASLR
jgi:ABC-type multidrug transport system ATPase subunit